MSSASQRRSLPRFMLILLTVCSVALAGIAASTFLSAASADHGDGAKQGETYCKQTLPDDELTIRQVLKKGFQVTFNCVKNYTGTSPAIYLETLKATGKLTVTPGVRRTLGLRSTVIASGTWTRGAPVTGGVGGSACTIEAEKCRSYTLRLPAASLKAKLKKKRVGMIRVHPTATLTYTAADGTTASDTFTEHHFDGPVTYTTGAATFACAKEVGRDLWYGCKKGGFRP